MKAGLTLVPEGVTRSTSNVRATNATGILRVDQSNQASSVFFKLTIRGVFTTGSVIFFGVTLALCIVAKQPSIPYELSPLQTWVPVQEAVCVRQCVLDGHVAC